MKAAHIVNKLLEADVDDPESFMQDFEPKFLIVRMPKLHERLEFWAGMDAEGWTRNPVNAKVLTHEEAQADMAYLRERLLAMDFENIFNQLQVVPVTRYRGASERVYGPRSIPRSIPRHIP